MKKIIGAVILSAMILSAVSCADVDYSEVVEPIVTDIEMSQSDVNSNDELTDKTIIGDTEVTINETVLIDKDNIKITAKEFVSDGFWGPEIKVLVENNTDKNLIVSTRNSCVNNYMVDTSMYTEVAAGKKANDSITISSNDLEACGIDVIADIEFFFHIYESDDWDTYLDSEKIRIETSEFEGYEYAYDDSGVLVYDAYGIKIVAKGLSKVDSIFGSGMILYMYNGSSEPITVQADNVSVNGFTIDNWLSEDIMPQKHTVCAMILPESDLEENEIETINEIECNFHIINQDTWDTIADSDIIKLNF